MDGPGILNLTIEIVPRLVQKVLAAAQLSEKDVELFLMHQATLKLIEQLRKHMKLDAERMPIALETVGNTVSSTLPLLMNDLRSSGRLRRGTRSLLAGFRRRFFLGRLHLDRNLGEQGRRGRRAGRGRGGMKRKDEGGLRRAQLSGRMKDEVTCDSELRSSFFILHPSASLLPPSSFHHAMVQAALRIQFRPSCGPSSD